MSKTAWAWIVVAIIILGGVFLWVSRAQAPSVDQNTAPADTTSGGSTSSDAGASVSGNVNVGTAAPTEATVTYDGSRFSPDSVTIAQGGTVHFIDSDGQMWVASDPHPVHDGYDGTSRDQHCASGYTGPAPFDECSPRSSFSFTFNKIGSWGYHDHLNAGVHGTVVVVAQ